MYFCCCSFYTLITPSFLSSPQSFSVFLMWSLTLSVLCLFSTPTEIELPGLLSLFLQENFNTKPSVSAAWRIIFSLLSSNCSVRCALSHSKAMARSRAFSLPRCINGGIEAAFQRGFSALGQKEQRIDAAFKHTYPDQHHSDATSESARLLETSTQWVLNTPDHCLALGTVPCAQSATPCELPWSCPSVWGAYYFYNESIMSTTSGVTGDGKWRWDEMCETCASIMRVRD